MNDVDADRKQQAELDSFESTNRPMGELSSWVRQDKKLAFAYYTLTIREMRLIWELVSRIRPTDNDFTEYDFSLSQLRELFGRHLTFADVEATLLRLYRRELHLEMDPTTREALRWVISAVRDESSETFRVALHPKLRTYFLRLQRWVQAEKATLCAFTGEYAARLYMMGCVHRNKRIRSWEVPILELRAHLGIAPNEYQRFSNLRARVLDAPIHEINERAAPFRMSFHVNKRRQVPISITFELQNWRRTTTGTGTTVAAKIKERCKKALRPDMVITAEDAELPGQDPEVVTQRFASIKAHVRAVPDAMAVPRRPK